MLQKLGIEKILLIKNNFMQTLKEKLKEDLKISIKNSNSLKKNLLRVVLGEIALEETSGKAAFILNDEGVMSIIRKSKSSLELTKAECKKFQKPIPEEVDKEIAILDTYLPQQMVEEEIKTEIAAIITEIGATSMKEMGLVMKAFTAKFSGKADGKLVSTIVREKLNG